MKAKKSKGKQEGKKVKEKNETREKVRIQRFSSLTCMKKKKEILARLPKCKRNGKRSIENVSKRC